jgi:maltose alpha-D-glucosyltransferase/alpha-amylase
MEQNLQPNLPWFKSATIYQLHVRGFYDSNVDGIGDFAGLTEKLDYIESLGASVIWLLPFFPSPLKDDGYDIASYCDIHSNYGSLKDFRSFLTAAHERGIRVITELVINHTSDQHYWFQRARQAPLGSSLRAYYIWSDTPDRYKEARIIFKDYEPSNWTWDPVAKSYYFHRFYSHQPDLNFENPLVQKEIFRVIDFWFGLGVDGLRLDAIPYLFKKEGTSCENLPETHVFVKKLRAYVDAKFQDRVLIAEANQWPDDVAAYFGTNDECHMAFHFPVMPRLFMALHMEDRFPIVDILEQTPHLPDSCQWIMFLRNHDELTLEMVSDEERDYMYRIYAKDLKARLNLGIRRRLAPLLDNDRTRNELMHILLFSLPGTPVMYYGDEIGMGDNIYLGDRNGIRTPMQWNRDRNAGFSQANPQKLYLPVIIDPEYHYELVNVENQEHNPSSLLWWIRRVLFVRKNHKAFWSGSLEFLSSDNHKVLSFIRRYEEEIILIAVNLSRFAQSAELDLSKYAGYIPQELFHKSCFPIIKEVPYNLTFGPCGYYWLHLKPSETLLEQTTEGELQKIYVERTWKNILRKKHRKKLEREVLPKFLKKARWFAHKSLTINYSKIKQAIGFANSLLCIVEVGYLEKTETEIYLIPLSFIEKGENTMQEIGVDALAFMNVDAQEGILYDSVRDETFRKGLLSCILNRRKMHIEATLLIPHAIYGLSREDTQKLSSRLIQSEQSNSSLLYGQKFFLKLYRRLEEGSHPEVEIARFLTKKKFEYTPKYVGSLDWKHSRFSQNTIAFVQDLVANEGTAWEYTLESLAAFYEQTLAHPTEAHPAEPIDNVYLEVAKVLGERTAQMHIALSSDQEGSFQEEFSFAPEPFSYLDQRSIYQDVRRNVLAIFRLLKKKISSLPNHIQLLASETLLHEERLLRFLQKVLHMQLVFLKIRIHGDYHLGQLLYTGKDFIIIDFEGEPLHSLSFRRYKRSCMSDVAGMLSSFHYAALKVLFSNPAMSPETGSKFEPLANAWYKQVEESFLHSYKGAISKSQIPLVPTGEEEFTSLLRVFLINKAVYEIGYELNVRPDWVIIACKNILTIAEGLP